jgi:hypothetical protein
MEEGESEIGFEGLDLAANGGLRHPAPLSCLSKIAGFCHRQESL